MKIWKIPVLVLCTACLLAVPAAGAPAGEEALDDASYYRFDGSRLAAPDIAQHARIEFEVGGQTVLTERVSFRLTAGEELILPLPSLDAVAGLAGAPGGEVAVHVFVGDMLLDSFDRAGFERYNRRLARREGAAPERLATDRVEAPAPPDAPTAEPREEGGMEWLTASFSVCEDSCRQEFRQCIMNCPDLECSAFCEDEYYNCQLTCPEADSDGDGVNNGNDNCLETYNPAQANCDGDAFGDACDSLDATYVVTIADQTCHIDHDGHVGYYDLEHHVERKETDVSSCGAPDRWVRRIHSETTCFNIDEEDCCLGGLSGSIASVGDDPQVWCHPAQIDLNYCH